MFHLLLLFSNIENLIHLKFFRSHEVLAKRTNFSINKHFDASELLQWEQNFELSGNHCICTLPIKIRVNLKSASMQPGKRRSEYSSLLFEANRANKRSIVLLSSALSYAKPPEVCDTLILVHPIDMFNTGGNFCQIVLCDSSWKRKVGVKFTETLHFFFTYFIMQYIVYIQKITYN